MASKRAGYGFSKPMDDASTRGRSTGRLFDSFERNEVPTPKATDTALQPQAGRKKYNFTGIGSLLESNSKANKQVPSTGLRTTGNTKAKVRPTEPAATDGYVTPPTSGSIDATKPDDDGFIKAQSRTELRKAKKEQKRAALHGDKPRKLAAPTQTWLANRENLHSVCNSIKMPIGKVIGTRGVHSVFGYRNTHTGGVECVPGARNALNTRFADQNPGTIVHHSILIDLPDNFGFKVGDEWIVEFGGINYSGKPRYWLIVGRSEWYVLEVPIFTNGDKGLEKVPKAIWNEFLNVRPKDAGRNYQAQNPDMPILRIKETTGGKAVSRETMVARWTMARTRRVDKNDVIRVAELEEEDAQIAVGWVDVLNGNTPKDA